MSIREMYEYTYYKVYKSMIFSTDWGADWRASGILLVLSGLTPLSLIFYFQLLFPYSSIVSDIKLYIIPAIMLSIIDHYTFHSKGQWKEIVKKYEAWPRKKNFRGTFIVWGIISLIIANFLLMIHLYDKVDWSQYQ